MTLIDCNEIDELLIPCRRTLFLGRGNFTAIGVEEEKIMKETPRDKTNTEISREGKMKRILPQLGWKKGFIKKITFQRNVRC